MTMSENEPIPARDFPGTAVVVPYPLTGPAFWSAYWITLRPYLFFISGVSGLVGLAIPEGIGWPVLAAALAAFSLSYGLGQALTDVFQTDTDAISSPYRPLTQGVITGMQVLIVSLIGLGLCALVFLLCNPWTLLFSTLGVLGLATYTPFKRHWWAGPFWNSWIVALLPLIGYLCSGANVRAALAARPVWGAMISVFFSYAIFVLLGYFKDISADRATGYITLPVRFGWRVSVAVSAFFVPAAALGSVVLLERALGTYFEPGHPARWLALLLWCAGLLVLAGAHGYMLRIGDESGAHLAIAWVVRGYVLLHLGESVVLKPALALFSLLFYALFEWALVARPEKSQI